MLLLLVMRRLDGDWTLASSAVAAAVASGFLIRLFSPRVCTPLRRAALCQQDENWVESCDNRRGLWYCASHLAIKWKWIAPFVSWMRVVMYQGGAGSNRASRVLFPFWRSETTLKLLLLLSLLSLRMRVWLPLPFLCVVVVVVVVVFVFVIVVSAVAIRERAESRRADEWRSGSRPVASSWLSRPSSIGNESTWPSYYRPLVAFFLALL